MPRPVVPTNPPPSSFLRWWGSTRCASFEIATRPGSRRARSASSSSRNVQGSITMPPPRDGEGLIVEGAAGQMVQLEDLLTHHHRVAGVGASGEANHEIRLASERVHHLAFALIPPLSTDDCDSGHDVTTSRLLSQGSMTHRRPAPGNGRRQRWMYQRPALEKSILDHDSATRAVGPTPGRGRRWAAAGTPGRPAHLAAPVPGGAGAVGHPQQDRVSVSTRRAGAGSAEQRAQAHPPGPESSLGRRRRSRGRGDPDPLPARSWSGSAGPRRFPSLPHQGMWTPY